MKTSADTVQKSENGKKRNWLWRIVTGWERYEGAFSPVPEKYGWANGNYFEAQRGRWVLVFYLKTLPKYQHKICPKDPFMVQFMAK